MSAWKVTVAKLKQWSARCLRKYRIQWGNITANKDIHASSLTLGRGVKKIWAMQFCLENIAEDLLIAFAFLSNLPLYCLVSTFHWIADRKIPATSNLTMYISQLIFIIGSSKNQIVASLVTRVWTINGPHACSVKIPISNSDCNWLAHYHLQSHYISN